MKRFLKVLAPVFVLALVLVACVQVTVTPTGEVIVTVCDYNGFPLEGAKVQLGDQVKTVGADGTVTFKNVNVSGDYDLLVYDQVLNELRVFFGLSGNAPGIVMPNSNTDPANVNSGQLLGQFDNDFSSGDIQRYIGAVVNGRSGFQQSVSSTFSHDANWSVEDGPTASIDFYGISAKYQPATIPGGFSFPGELIDWRADLVNTTLPDGGSGTVNVDLADYLSGNISGSTDAIPGFERVALSAGVTIGTTSTNNGVDFQLQSDFAGSQQLPASFSYVSRRAPSGWSFNYWTEVVYFNNTTFETIITSQTNLDFNASGFTVSPALTAAPDVSGVGSGFNEDTTFDIGDPGDNTVKVALTPTSMNPDSLSLFLFADGNGFSNNQVPIPDLSLIGASLIDDDEYDFRLQEFSWPLSTMASKLASVSVLNGGVSYREDLTTGRSEILQIFVTPRVVQ